MTRRVEDIHRGLTPDDPGDHLLTLAQVGRRLGISPRLVRDHVKEGRLRAIDVGAGKVNQCLRFTSADISEFLRNRQAVPCPSIKGPALKPTRLTFKSKVIGFQEAQALRRAAKQKTMNEQRGKKPGPGSSERPPLPPRP